MAAGWWALPVALRNAAIVIGELGLDVALDHRADDLAEHLRPICPSGIDIYFESVGGHVWNAVFAPA